jgi:hypothetical protein
MFSAAQDIDAHSSALQIADRADGFVREQLETPGMHPGEHCHRQAFVQANNQRCCEGQAEIDLPTRDHLRMWSTLLRGHVADVVETLGTQQVFGDVPGRDADRGVAA